MTKIAITGNIGSGKTTALNFFKKKQYFTLSSDEIIKHIYSNDILRSCVLKTLNIKFKDYKAEIITKMTSPYFNSKLKKTLYPIMNEIRKKRTYKHITKKKLFFEIPLLFEEKLEKNYDLIIFIKSDHNIRLKRVLAKGMTENYFRLMSKYQQTNSLKQISSDITILNNGSVFDLYESLNWCERSL